MDDFGVYGICILFSYYAGVGERTEELLRDAGILTLQQLREADVEAIVKAGVPRYGKS